MKRLLSIALVAILLLGVAIPAVSVAETKTGVVRGGWLRLRSAASFEASTISSYYTGTVVTILSTTGSWYQVRTPDGRTGYMYSSYITVTGSGGGTGTSTVWSSNGYGVRMRTGPGTGYRVLAVYPVGTKVTVLERGSYWSHIQVGSLRGYMMNQFLIGGSIPDPTPGGDATVWSSNGYGVRLRTGPSKSYSIIGVYSVGTSVKVLEKGSVWSYIQIGSRIGYMMTEFLIFNPTAPVEVTSVTLNYKIPVAGSTLKIASLTPAGANVSYKWVWNGTTVGTGSTLQVKDIWAGKPITLTVKGKDGYTGSASVSTGEVLADGTLQSFMTNIDGLYPVVGNVLRVAEVNPKGALYTCKWTIERTDGTTITKTTNTYTVVDADAGATINLTLKGTSPFSGDITDQVGIGVVQATGTVDAVTIINTTNPNSISGYAAVGDKLSATFEPAVATVNYEWWADTGTGLKKTSNTTASYTVPSNALEVELKVIGKGKYTGEQTDSVTIKTGLPAIKTVTLAPSGTTNPTVGSAIVATVLDNQTPQGTVGSGVTYVWYVGGKEVAGATGDSYTPTIDDVGKQVHVKVYGDNDSYTGILTSAKTAVVKTELTGVTIACSSGTVQAGATLVAETEPEKGGGSYTWYASNDNFATKTKLSSTKKECFVPTGYQYFMVVVTPATNYTCATSNVSDSVALGDTLAQPRVAFTLQMAPMVVPEEDGAETPTEIPVETPAETETTFPTETETTDPTDTETTLPMETETTDPTDATETETTMPTDTPTDEPTDPPTQDQNPPAPEPAMNPVPVEPITYSVSLEQKDGKLIASIQPLPDTATLIVQYAWYDGNDKIADEKASEYTIREGDEGKTITVKVRLLADDVEIARAKQEIIVAE